MSTDVQNGQTDAEHDGEDAIEGVPQVDVASSPSTISATLRGRSHTATPSSSLTPPCAMASRAPARRWVIQEKMEIAHQLARLASTSWEAAGFPAASPGDLRGRSSASPTAWAPASSAARTARSRRRPPRVGLAPRTTRQGVEAAGRHPPAIHIFLATSDYPHAAQAAGDALTKCWRPSATWCSMRSPCSDVEFSPRMAGSDPEFWSRCWRWRSRPAHHAQHSRHGEYTTPDEYGGLIKHLRENTPGGKDVIFSATATTTWAGHGQHALACRTARARSKCDHQRHRRAPGNTSPEESVALHVATDLPPGDEHPHPRDPPHQRHGEPLHGMVIQPNKPSSAPTPLRTRPASTRTACSSTKRTYEIMDASDHRPEYEQAGAGKHPASTPWRASC